MEEFFVDENSAHSEDLAQQIKKLICGVFSKGDSTKSLKLELAFLSTCYIQPMKEE